MTPSPTTLIAAQIVVGLVLLYEVALLARFLAWRADDPRPGEGRRLVLHGLALALVFALTAAMLARSGALAPGVSGAGMPWEQVTDDTPLGATAQAGQRAYLNRCAPCHLPEGTGLPPAYPPLVGSVILRATKEVHAQVALWGSDALHGVSAHAHPVGRARMPAFAAAASDAELASILTYERVVFSMERRASEGTPFVDPDSTRHHVRPSDIARARAGGPPR
jgi:mono/diheme cytochrome c family protein